MHCFNRSITFLFLMMTLPFVTACRLNTAAGAAARPASVTASRLPRPAGASTPELRFVTQITDFFRVRPAGARGPLVVYDMLTRQVRFTLPAGILSADGQHYFAAMPYPYPGEAATIVTLFDLGTGKPYDKFRIDGQWELSGVSPSGRWLALTRLPSENEKRAWTKANQWQTDIQIVEAETGKTTHTLNLDGNFEVETISADGNSLFLIQHLPAVNPDHYLIRLYDLSTEALQADPLRAKGADEVMAGLAWEGVASSDGHWLLTLYLNTQRDVAFIHTLDLQDKYPVCIDLPSGNGDLNLLKFYMLALSPDGQTIYAINPALGVVAAVDLNTRQVVRTVQFQAHPPAAAKYDLQAPAGRSAISKNGQAVYFASGKDLWVYDTRQGEVRSLYSFDALILGLGLSGDGQQLYVASAGRPPMVWDITGASVMR